MTVNSVTGCKEVANLLHKCGHGISYADIRHLNKSWATRSNNKYQIHNNQILPSTFSSGRSSHVVIDNFDRKQHTIARSKTKHYTNGVAFQQRTSNPTELIWTQNIEKA